MNIVYEPSKNPLGKSQFLDFDGIELKAGLNRYIPETIKQHPDYELYVKAGALSVQLEEIPVREEPKEPPKKKPNVVHLTE